MADLRIGILGVGGIASVHMQRLQNQQNVVITALCDANKENLESSGKALAKVKRFTDYKSFLNKQYIDAVYICIPPFAHCGQVEYAASQKIDIFLEKPIALDMVRAESMAKAIQSNGVICQVGYHMRFGKAVQEFLRLKGEGRTGKPTLLDGFYRCNSLHAPWWRMEAKSGGQLFEQVIHLYDLAMFLFGTPKTVMSMMANLCHTAVEDYTIEDTSASLITFEGGAIASITASNCAVPGKWESGFTVVCERMVGEFKDANHATFTFTDGTEPHQVVVESGDDLKELESLAFIEAVRGRLESACPIEQGLRSLLLVDSLKRSAKAGRLMSYGLHEETVG